MPTQAEGQTYTFETFYEPQGRLPPPRPAERSKLGLTEDELFVAFGAIGILCLFWLHHVIDVRIAGRRAFLAKARNGDAS